MAVSSRIDSPPPQFPYWPFSCLSLYARMARDLGGYAEAMASSTDAMEAARAEADLGVRLYGDLMQACWDLALAPWTAMARVAARQASDAAPPVPAIEAGSRSRGFH